MAVAVDAKSASITLAKDKAQPDVAVRSGGIVCHLTNGFDPNEQFDPTKPNRSRLAWSATGKLKLTKAAADSLTGWEFGFIQFQKVNAISFFYAGKTASAGSIIIHAHEPPLLPQKTALDSFVGFSPWTKNTPRFKATGNDIECETGDHPMMAAGFSRKNRKTNQDNFLFHVIDDREFFTVLSARDPAGKLTHLRNFHSHLRYDFQFNWRANNPVKRTNTSSITFGTILDGPPTAAELSGMIADPIGPFANDLCTTSVLHAVTTSNPTNRNDLDRRFVNVPPDFFQ